MKIKKLFALLLSGILLANSMLFTSNAATKAEEEEEIEYGLVNYTAIEYNSPEEKLATMTLYDEKGDYQLWALEETGEIALVTKGKDGNPDQILFSNPYNVASMDKDVKLKERLLSQIILKYSDGEMNSYEQVAKNRQIKLEYIRGGIRVNYTMGREQARILVPEMIEKERFEENILNKMPNNGVADEYVGKVPYTYMRAYFNTLKDPNKPGLSSKSREDMLAAYPITNKYAVYILDPNATVLEKKKLEHLITKYTDYTFDDLDSDHAMVEHVAKEDKIPLFKVSIEYLLDEQGLTVRVPASDIRFDSSSFSLSSITILPYFGAGSKYETGFTLVNDGSGSIVRFEDVAEREAELTITGKVYGQDYSYHQIGGENQEVMRLPAFGTVTNSEYWGFDIDGYNAAVESGEIIPYSDIEANIERIKAEKEAEKNGAVVEEPESDVEEITEDVAEVENTEAAAEGEEISEEAPQVETAPLTGLQAEHPRYSKNIAQSGKYVKFDDEKTKITSGFIAYIEEGETLAEITTAHGGNAHDYNSAYATFTPIPKDSYELDGLSATGNATWSVTSNRKYNGNFTIRYIPVRDENATTAGMAAALRNYLENEGVLKKLKDDGKDIPLYVETFGSIQTTKRIAGIPFKTQTPLTTFADAKSMLEELTGKKAAADGKTYNTTSNIVIKYTGWYNGGMFKTVPSKIKIDSVISEDMTLSALTKYAKQIGAKIYPDLEFTYVNNVGFGDGFDYKKDAVQTMDGRTAVHKVYSSLFQTFEPDGQLIISPLAMDKYYAKIAKDYKGFGASGLSVSTLGSDLSSDHNDKYAFTREEAKDSISDLLETMKSDNGSLLVDGGNAYALEYADHILNVPLNSSENVFASESIPFVGMVLHGYKNFAGTAINLDGDYEKSVLKAIENGASPYFILSYQHNNTSELKSYAEFTKFYSIRYNIWLSDLVETYNKLNDALSSVKYETITGHDIIDTRIVKVTYSNGEQFVLNYNIDDYTYTDEAGTEHTIPAMDYVKFGK
ncbi:MAG: hypothetical protein IKI97_13390 [Clostridia bacterium]|nr:hypothetical protein [Clostridia bacterium]